MEDCEIALKQLYLFASDGWKQAARHLIACDRFTPCSEVWLGWQLCVTQAVRLQIHCGSGPFSAAAEDACGKAMSAIRMSHMLLAPGPALREAMAHVVECKLGGCSRIQLAFLRYLGAMNLINAPAPCPD